MINHQFKFAIQIVLAIFIVDAHIVEAKSIRPCSHITFEIDKKLKFTEAEARLMCGDSSLAPWASIPRSQARYFIKNFLETRGYYYPTFEDTKDQLIVNVGPLTLVEEFQVEGAPDDLDLRRYWQPVGKPLTPKSIDDVVEWVKHRLQTIGFPCPHVEAKADSRTGIVKILAEPGPRQYIISMPSEPVADLKPEVLRRYDAIGVGDLYNGDYLTLTSRRTVADDILLSTYFTETCADHGVKVMQRVFSGEPRVVRFGIGFNTEKYFLLRASHKNTRLGSDASSLLSTAMVSYREQEAQVAYDWHHVPEWPRYLLRPSISFKREFEIKYETRTTALALAPTLSYDFDHVHVSGNAGPALNVVETFRGEGPAAVKIATIDTALAIQSHYYEYYSASPQEGFNLNFKTSLGQRRWGSDVTAKRFDLNGTLLHNWRLLDPPIFVFGLRGGLSTIVTDSGGEKLPPNYRTYLGGSRDLRGFARRSLPNNGDGGLTAGYLSSEIRLNSLIPYHIQPLVLADVGRTGVESMHLDKTLYWSPGFGVRWESPIGSFRMTIARGFVIPNPDDIAPSGISFYLSYGEEF